MDSECWMGEWSGWVSGVNVDKVNGVNVGWVNGVNVG